MKNFLAISLLVVASMAWGQSVTITARVLDPTGKPYQNGSGRAVLVPQNQSFFVNGTNPVNPLVVISGLDSFGGFSIQLTNTSLITPASANPQWQFSFCSQVYPVQPLPVCFTMTPMSLTSSQDISVQAEAQSALLPNLGGGSSITLETNGTLNGSQALLNLVQGLNVTLTDNGLGAVTIDSTGGSSGNLPGYVVLVPPGSSQSAIQTILNSAVAGDEIWFSGTYEACGIGIGVDNVRIRGMGVDGTTIQCSTANSPVFVITGSSDELSGITFQHITNSPTCPGGAGTNTCGDGLQVRNGARTKVHDIHANFNYNGVVLGWTTYAEFSNSISEYNNGHGVAFVMSATNPHMQWQVARVLSEQNLGNGFDMTCPASFTSVQTAGPYITGWTNAYGNEGYGFNFSCSSATTSGIADIFVGDVFSSQNNASGFRFDLGPNGGRNTIMNGSYSEQAGTYNGNAGFAQAAQTVTNVGSGIEITASCDPTVAPVISNVAVWENSFSGVTVACPGTSISNVSSFGNGAASASAPTEAGITLNASNAIVTGGYHRKGTTENYGVYVQSGSPPPSIVGVVCDSSISAPNCKFGAPPNLRCETGIGDGLNAIAAGTYLQSFCYNDSRVTWTVAGVLCYVDGGSTSTLNAAGNTLGALLTGAITCGTAGFASGTQSANVALTPGDYIKFTFVADGTAKQSSWVVSFVQ